MSKKTDVTVHIGKKYGLLTVLKEAESESYKTTMVECFCDCGNITVKSIYKITTGHTSSCGCFKYHHNQDNITHGLTKHPLYRRWANMVQRTEYPKSNRYHVYGARGIKICVEWRKDFKKFYEWAIANGWNENMQIDRINNDGDYCPSNCRIVTPKENMNNTSKNRNFVINGQTFNLTQLATLHNMTPSRLWARLNKGWNLDTALNKPLKKWAAQ